MKLSDIERSKKIGYVPQEIIFGETTVFDAVLLGRKPYISFHVSHDDLKRTEEVLIVYREEKNKELPLREL